jgi:hypothetical protein
VRGNFFQTFWQSCCPRRPENDNKTLLQPRGISDSLPVELSVRDDIDAPVRTRQTLGGARFQHQNALRRHIALLRRLPGQVDELGAAHDQTTGADSDLSSQIRHCGRRASRRVDSSGGDDAVQGRGHHGLTVTDDSNDVFVGTVRTHAVGMSQAVGDPLDEIAKLSLVDGV